VSGQSCGHAPRTTPFSGVDVSVPLLIGEVIVALGDSAT
jgi:hypothetical protein